MAEISRLDPSKFTMRRFISVDESLNSIQAAKEYEFQRERVRLNLERAANVETEEILAMNNEINNIVQEVVRRLVIVKHTNFRLIEDWMRTNREMVEASFFGPNGKQRTMQGLAKLIKQKSNQKDAKRYLDGYIEQIKTIECLKELRYNKQNITPFKGFLSSVRRDILDRFDNEFIPKTEAFFAQRSEVNVGNYLREVSSQFVMQQANYHEFMLKQISEINATTLINNATSLRMQKMSDEAYLLKHKEQISALLANQICVVNLESSRKCDQLTQDQHLIDPAIEASQIFDKSTIEQVTDQQEESSAKEQNASFASSIEFEEPAFNTISVIDKDREINSSMEKQLNATKEQLILEQTEELAKENTKSKSLNDQLSSLQGKENSHSNIQAGKEREGNEDMKEKSPIVRNRLIKRNNAFQTNNNSLAKINPTDTSDEKEINGKRGFNKIDTDQGSEQTTKKLVVEEIHQNSERDINLKKYGHKHEVQVTRSYKIVKKSKKIEQLQQKEVPQFSKQQEIQNKEFQCQHQSRGGLESTTTNIVEHSLIKEYTVNNTLSAEEDNPRLTEEDNPRSTEENNPRSTEEEEEEEEYPRSAEEENQRSIRQESSSFSENRSPSGRSHSSPSSEKQLEYCQSNKLQQTLSEDSSQTVFNSSNMPSNTISADSSSSNSSNREEFFPNQNDAFWSIFRKKFASGLKAIK